jgi:hypothetical protein
MQTPDRDVLKEAIAWSMYPIHLDPRMSGISYINGKMISTCSVECYLAVISSMNKHVSTISK